VGATVREQLLQTWLTAVDGELAFHASHPPQPPATWERGADFSCKCADCKVLKEFLRDPEAQTLRRPLMQARRQHQHQIIDRHKLDTTHVTERKGRPYTLVCTKTRGAYDRAVAAHKIDVKQHAQIQPLVKWHASLATSRPHPGASGSP
jgi:hypothetical protein